MEPGQVLVLLLSILSIVSGLPTPSFFQPSWRSCDDTACWHNTFPIEVTKTLQVPNSSLIISDFDWDWWEVTTESLVQACSPSLPFSQLPDTEFISCDGIDYEFLASCRFVNKGWLNSNGDITTSFLESTFNSLEHANSYIGECLAWDTDGEHDLYYYTDNEYDYDYNYDYDYDYNWSLKDSSADNIRVKREVDGLEENLKRREIRRTKRKQQLKKKKKAKRNRDRNGKINNRRMKNGNRRGNQQDQRKSKKKKRKVKKKKTIEKPRRKKYRQANKHGNNKQKKKKNITKKTLKKIGLKSAPTKSVLNKLNCIDHAVRHAFEECGQKILNSVDLPSD